MKFNVFKFNKINKLLIGLIVLMIVGLVLAINVSLAKYKITESFSLVKGTINYTFSDIIVVAYYDGQELENFPAISDGYSVESVICDNGATGIFDEKLWQIKVSSLTVKGTTCMVNFKENTSANYYILSNVSLGSETPNFGKTSCTSGCDEATVGLYSTLDDDGTTYYFRGDVVDNYLKFAGYYWRIIRINGDGSIRILYNGSSVNSSGEKTLAIPSINYNSSYTDNMYVGFMYSSGVIHGVENKSDVLSSLETFYINNLASYESYIDINAGFCGDRSTYTDEEGTISGGGTGTTETYYGAYIRLITNKMPNLICLDNSDLYTISGSSKGNKALTYPIGLITADEIAYAGGVQGSYGTFVNTSYYLYNNQYYWTMTPTLLGSGWAYVFIMENDGSIGFDKVTSPYSGSVGIRPVINLRSDLELIGSGTSSDPFEVSGDAL